MKEEPELEVVLSGQILFELNVMSLGLMEQYIEIVLFTITVFNGYGHLPVSGEGG